MKKTDAIHLLFRYSDKLYKINNTIEEHQKVIINLGSVWFGKVGKPIGHKWIDSINEQVEKGLPSYLFLVQYSAGRFHVSKGSIVKLARQLPSDEESLIPPYYLECNLLSNITSWVKLSTIEQSDEKHLLLLRSVSSVTQMSESLRSSMAGFFIVREKAAVS